MRLQILSVAAALAIAGTVLEAQTNTADGVAAFLREDYERAAQILKPLAERWTDGGDPVAQFFMAMMYESGRGVPADAIRACTLYGLGGLGPFDGSPFSKQSLKLFQNVRQSLGREQFEECTLFQSIGFDHGFQSATFALESADSIAIDLRSATITYQGKQRRVDALVPTAHGVLFLPIEHTRLLAGSARSTPHHYIEVFRWIPIERQTWVLMWSLSEVIRDNVIRVTTGELTRVSAPRPPADSSFDIREFVQLGVNDSGVPEWTILTGRDARSHGIPSEAERDEVAALERARRTADERVDWKRVLDSSRTPAMTYSDASGCGNVQLYGWSRDRGEAISIRVNKDLVPLTPGRVFTLALPQPGVDIEVQMYDRPYRSLPFCTDVSVHEAGSHVETWTAVAGTVTIELSPRGVRAVQPDLYRATVRMTNGELTSAAGIRVRQTQPVTLTAVVGTFY
jgi:hypothetical protein